MAHQCPQRQVPQPSAFEPRERFLHNLPEIERIIGRTCHRFGLRGSDAEDFASHIKLKLIEDEYAILARFRSESRLSTYLTSVIRNLGRDYLHHCHGRWRPSAEARRLGVEAVRLERLLVVDRRGVQEAVEMIAAREGCSVSRRELQRIAHRLPVRFLRRFLGEEHLTGLTAGIDTERRVEERENRRILRRIRGTLRDSLRALEEEELRILRLHYHDGLKLTEVARRLELPRRRVYTIRDRSLRQLRRSFEQRGVSPDEIDRVLGCEAGPFRIDFRRRSTAV
jgi:RNA polymerase sigma factor (sigma-70 family)